MALTDPNVIAAVLALLVAQSEAVPTASFAFAPREADLVLPLSGFGLGVGRECPTEVDRGLLEHLRGNLVPPRQARDLLGDSAVRGGDEDAPGGLAALPAVVGIDQVESRPRYPDLWVGALGGKGVGDQLKALVVGEPRRPTVPGEHHRLRGGGSEREPEGGVPHGTQDRTRRTRQSGNMRSSSQGCRASVTRPISPTSPGRASATCSNPNPKSGRPCSAWRRRVRRRDLVRQP